MDRFEIERHIRRSTLKGPSRTILLVLCTTMDGKTGLIPDRWQPSLSDLARWSGFHRRTVARHLNKLESAAWITRLRPDPYLARTQHLTTFYTVHVPDFFGPEASDSPPEGLMTLSARAGGRKRPALGAERSPAGDSEPPNPAEHEVPAEQPIVIRDDDSLTAIATAELHALTGRTISEQRAREAVRLVLEGRAVRNPTAYLRRALRADPKRFLPAPSGPPQFRDGKFTE